MSNVNKMKRPISGFTNFSFTFILILVQTLTAVKSQYLDSELLDELGTPRLFDEYLSFQAGNITINLVPWVFYTFLAFVLGKYYFHFHRGISQQPKNELQFCQLDRIM